MLNECPDDLHIVPYIVPDIVSDLTIYCTISYVDIVPDILNTYAILCLYYYTLVVLYLFFALVVEPTDFHREVHGSRLVWGSHGCS